MGLSSKSIDNEKRIKDLEDQVAKLASMLAMICKLGEQTAANVSGLGQLILNHIKQTNDAIESERTQSLN